MSSTKPVRSVAIIKFNEKGEMSIDVVDNSLEQLGILGADFKIEQQKKEISEDKKSFVNSKKVGENGIKLTTNPKETTPVMKFLAGESCLTGGTGWWKFEFCYGVHVRQFHLEKSVETSIMLGKYDEEAHIKWIKNNPEKRPKPKNVRTELSHFYHGGTPCEKTGDKRQTEVKLRCSQNSPSSTSVSIYLLEPKTCQYTLVVESQIICEILQIADDEYGLVLIDKLISSTGTGHSSVGKEDKPTEAVYIGKVPIEDLEVRYENN